MAMIFHCNIGLKHYYVMILQKKMGAKLDLSVFRLNLDSDRLQFVSHHVDQLV